MKNIIFRKSKLLILGLIMIISIFGSIAYASNTGTIGELFKYIGGKWFLIGSNIETGTVSTEQLSDKSITEIKVSDSLLTTIIRTIGDQTIEGIKTFTSPVFGVLPIEDNHLVTKKYVDDKFNSISGISNLITLSVSNYTINGTEGVYDTYTFVEGAKAKIVSTNTLSSDLVYVTTPTGVKSEKTVSQMVIEWPGIFTYDSTLKQATFIHPGIDKTGWNGAIVGIGNSKKIKTYVSTSPSITLTVSNYTTNGTEGVYDTYTFVEGAKAKIVSTNTLSTDLVYVTTPTGVKSDGTVAQKVIDWPGVFTYDSTLKQATFIHPGIDIAGWNGAIVGIGNSKKIKTYVEKSQTIGLTVTNYLKTGIEGVYDTYTFTEGAKAKIVSNNTLSTDIVYITGPTGQKYDGTVAQKVIDWPGIFTYDSILKQATFNHPGIDIAGWNGAIVGIGNSKKIKTYVEKLSTYSYNWSYGSWSSCSVSCGNGFQTRTASCVRNDGLIVANSFCGTAITSQTCNLGACSVPGCNGGTAVWSSPDGKNTCTGTWGSTAQGAYRIGNMDNGGTLNGTCLGNDTWSWNYTCPNKVNPVTICVGGGTYVKSLDGVNNCYFSRGQGVAGNTYYIPGIGTATLGGTASGLCNVDGSWNYLFKCPSAQLTCPSGGGQFTGSDGKTVCSFTWNGAYAGQTKTAYNGTASITSTCGNDGKWGVPSVKCP